MMRRIRDIKRVSLLLLILLFLITSCIKEDRSECPSILILDLSRLRKEVKWVNLWVYDSTDVILDHNRIERSDFANRYEIAVPKNVTKVFIWGNIGDSTQITGYDSKSDIISNKGAAMDSLYFFSTIIYPKGEHFFQKVNMSREFLKIYINVLSHLPKGRELQVELRGNTIGYTIQKEVVIGKLSILKNPFERYEENDKWNRFSYIIPKQENIYSLSISLFSNTKNERYSIGTINLGEIIAEQFRDNRLIFNDITIVIDFSNLHFSLNIGDWNYDSPLEVTI